MIFFIKRQIKQIYNGGRIVFIDKLIKIFYLSLNIFKDLILCLLFIPFFLLIRIIRPFIVIRFGELNASRIGHLAANTELYLCEKKAGINIPSKKYIDLFHIGNLPICNKYLINKWKQFINIWPRWIIHPLNLLNNFVPFGEIHKVGNNCNQDRDILNLLDKYPPHINFTKEEENIGLTSIKSMGISSNSKFVCLLVRDNAYLKSHLKNINSSYHNYRDCNIDNYYLAANELTKMGYFVIRMGAKVNSIFKNGNPMIIDYANNGMRTEFLDIYLGAKCDFCISTSSGWDAIPLIFRRPIIYAPIIPLGYFFTFSNRFIAITKHHFDFIEKRELTFSEIFQRNLGFCLTSEEYIKNGVELIENSPEEIRDLVIEFVQKKNNSWIIEENDEYIQNLFWKKFPINAKDYFGKPLHGEIKARFGTHFLRKNLNLLK